MFNQNTIPNYNVVKEYVQFLNRLYKYNRQMNMLPIS